MRYWFLAAISGLLLIGAAGFASSDVSKAKIWDLPPGYVADKTGVEPGSALTPTELQEMESYRFAGDTLKLLVIPVEWSNRLSTYSTAELEELIFSRNVHPGGSVADWFYEVSYGRLNVVGDVLDWYDAGIYDGSGDFYFEPIFDSLDSEIDYSQYDADNDGNVDAAIFLRSGTGEEDTGDPSDIWSYAYIYPLGSGPGPFDGVHIPRWNTSPEERPTRFEFCPPFIIGDTINRIRVFCHELSHNLGLPDLYDYDDKLVTSTYYTPNDNNDHPIVDWCIMGYYGYGIFSTGSEVPSHLCGWSKKELGWIDPVVLGQGSHEIVMYDIETNTDSSLFMLPINLESGEYFLLEFRNTRSSAQYDKTDSDFSVYLCPDLSPGCDTLDRGLLITHIDETVSDYWDFNNGTPSYDHYGAIVEDIGYNPVLTADYNPEGNVTDSAQWWYPYETRKGAALNPAGPGLMEQFQFTPTTYPSSDGYSGPTGIEVRVDSIVDERLYAYVYTPLDFDMQVVSHTPVTNETNVTADVDIIVFFNVDIVHASIDSSTVIASGSVSGPHLCYYGYSDALRRLTLEPDFDFEPGEVVSVSVSSGLEAGGGIPFGNPIVWSFTINVGGGNAEFVRGDSYYTGDGTETVVCAKINGDEHTDIVAVSYPDNHLFTLWGNGDGTFTPNQAITTDAGPVSVCAADMDGDYDMDVVVSSSTASTISVQLNNGSGGFLPRNSYSVGFPAGYIDLADFDADGDVDVVVADWQNNRVATLKNNGSGSLAVTGFAAAGNYPYDITAGDLDGDGDLDVATANFLSNDVSVLMNNGDGTFASGTEYATGSGPAAIQAGDLDNDTDLDLVVANGLGDSVAVLLNDGNGSFTLDDVYDMGASPGGMGLGDFDGDGDLDVVVPNITPNTISIMCNDGGGALGGLQTYTTGDEPYWLDIADFDHDGDLDIVTANNESDNVTVFLNQLTYVAGDADGSGDVDIDDVVYLITYIFSGGPGPDPYEAGDCNCSGDVDIDDAVYLIAYIFSGGPPPNDLDNNGVPDC